MGFRFDVKCFFGTLMAVIKSDGIVEGCKDTITADINKIVAEKEMINK